MNVWHLGNTTVRNPYRLKSALEALQNSTLQGKLIGRDQESRFAELLHEEGIVNVARIEEEEGGDYSDLGRKWRSALSQLGFITHKISRVLESNGVDSALKIASEHVGLSGKPFEITANGKRLIDAEIITLEQDAILRSLLAYRIPSIIESSYDCNPFSPIKFVVDVLFKISELSGEQDISFDEFELFIQTSTPDDGIENIARQVIEYRANKIANNGRVRHFKKVESEKRVKDVYGNIADWETKARTFRDYADLNLRYLKATGLFVSKGKGIKFSPIKQELAKLINQQEEVNLTGDNYLVDLWNGAILPTDNAEVSKIVSESLKEKITNLGDKPIDTSEDDENTERLKLEFQFEQLLEWNYYKDQSSQCDDISKWITALINNKKIVVSEDYEIKIPSSEAPAYFEWIIWRSFLAINSLKNKPWEARRFKIDQDFLPIHHAPGNGPDMVFEFEDFTIVVEVTLTTSSRQEAAEGEPVRRHVAKYLENSDKPVLGLFIAINIDTNTANTFKIGEWYLTDDTKLNLDIVPIKLEDFQRVFNYGSDKLSLMPKFILELMQEARRVSHLEAPQWKNEISEIIKQKTVA